MLLCLPFGKTLAQKRVTVENLPNFDLHRFHFGFLLGYNTSDFQIKMDGVPTVNDFGWNPKLFPDPVAQIADYAALGYHFVGIRKPRVANDLNVAMMRLKDWLLPVDPTDPNGGDTRFRNINFALPEVRAWWGENNAKFLQAGTAAFWNDEREAAFSE